MALFNTFFYHRADSRASGDIQAGSQITEATALAVIAEQAEIKKNWLEHRPLQTYPFFYIANKVQAALASLLISFTVRLLLIQAPVAPEMRHSYIYQTDAVAASEPFAQIFSMTKNQFTETYNKLPDDKLISILENAKDYQPLAIETAKQELTNRGLSETQIREVKKSLADAKSLMDAEEQKRKEKIAAARNTADKALSLLDPLVEKTPDRSIKLICLALGILALAKIISNFSMPIIMLENTSGWDFSTAFFFFDLLFLPIALIPFWNRRRIGLTLLSIWLSYITISSMWFFISLFLRADEPTVLFSFFPLPDLTTILVTVFISSGLLYFINKKSSRSLFR